MTGALGSLSPDAGWAEFDGNGIHAIPHAGDEGAGSTQLNLLVEDVATTVYDEAYNRTLHVTTPDGDTLWINGTQTDLHGYTRQN